VEPDSVVLSYCHEGAVNARVLCRINKDDEIVFHNCNIGFRCHRSRGRRSGGCCGVGCPRGVGRTGLVVLLPLLLPAFQCIVALPFAIRTFLAGVVGASVRVAIGSRSVFVDLSEVGVRVAFKLCDVMMFLGDDLVDDPFAGHFGRIAAGEDGLECGIQVGEVKCNVVCDDDVRDNDLGGLKLVVGEDDLV